MPTKYCLPFCIFFIAVSLGGCVTRSYYISPLYGTASSYHTMPLQRDSIKSSLYVNGAFNVGGNNEDLRDKSFSFQSSIYNTRQFGMFKAWYGAGINLGNYEVSRYDSNTINPDFDTAVINKNAGNKFFGSANIGAGMSIVVPVSHAGEWRIIGISGTMQNEFGRYLQFRQDLEKTNTHVSTLIPNSTLGTIGISSELAFNTGAGSISFQAQLNYLLGKSYTYTEYDNNGQNLQRRYNYMSNTFAFTRHRTTGFAQVNFGKRMSNFEIGMNYRLLATKKKNTSDH